MALQGAILGNIQHRRESKMELKITNATIDGMYGMETLNDLLRED